MKANIRIGRFLPVLLVFLLQSGFLFSQTTGKNGMASTAHPLASDAAIEILKAGGNAVDAAVAAAFAIGVVEPDGSGLGGGGGMVIYLKESKEAVFINYYGNSSENAEGSGFSSSRDQATAKAIGVPGTVGGLLAAHKKYGSLPLPIIMSPAIRYAEKGFAVDGTLATLILDNIDKIMSDQATAAIFLDEGFPKMEGDILVQKELARILREVSEEGRSAFYEGKNAEAFVKGINERGGFLTLDDLASYRPKISVPLKGSYRGYEVLAAGIPQSGISLIMGLNILENHDFSGSEHYSRSAETLHLMAETLKLITADRYEYMGDPDFVDVPVQGMISKEYALSQFNRINMTKLDPPTYRETKAGDPSRFGSITEEEPTLELVEMEGHTTTLSVIDKDGNAVALTQTLGHFFGSGQTVSGVLFNNAMTNYSYLTANVNLIKNRKQCRSTISPSIVLKDGKPFLILGSPGAARITSTVLELVVNVIDFGMDVEEANQAPRFFCQKQEDNLHLESGIDNNVRTKLAEMGHKLKVYEGIDLFFGGAQMIMVDPVTGICHGSADLRRGGSVTSY
ncbi:MAG: gamma-glutamyltransferase [Bacteroidales bacterium]|nr:gamma-glutamyltransferase [Bacteroidales bacterium]